MRHTEAQVRAGSFWPFVICRSAPSKDGACGAAAVEERPSGPVTQWHVWINMFIAKAVHRGRAMYQGYGPLLNPTVYCLILS
jgi:hypothetical protein